MLTTQLGLVSLNARNLSIFTILSILLIRQSELAFLLAPWLALLTTLLKISLKAV